MFCFGCHRGDLLLPTGLHMVGAGDHKRCVIVDAEIHENRPAKFVAAYKRRNAAQDRVESDQSMFPDFEFFYIENLNYKPVYIVMRKCRPDACAFAKM